MRRHMLCSLLALLLIPALLSAYTIVLKNGQRIEAQGRYVVEGNMAKFTDSNGRQRQVPVGDIDVVATERANAAGATTIPVPRAGDTKRGPKVWTNDEIDRLVRGDKTLVVGSPVAPASSSETTTAETGPPAVEAAPAEEAQPQKPKEQTPEYWQDRMKPLREEMAKVDQQLQQLRSGQNQAASNAINVNTDAPGVDVADTIQRLEQRRSELQRQIEGIQSEARRAGVPPGWVR